MQNLSSSSSADSQGAAQNVNLRHYWHVILERRWLVVAAFISVFVLCLVYLYKAPKIYAATTRIQINREEEGVLSLRDVLSGSGIEQDYLQTQYKNLMSRSLLETVFKKLKLGEDPYFAVQIDPIKYLAECVTITPIRLSRLVDVRAEHPDAEKASKIANALAEEFLDRNLQQKKKKTLDMLLFLKSEAEGVENQVKRAEEDLQDYRKKTKIVTLDSDKNTTFLALSQANETYAKVVGEAKTLETTVVELEKHIAAGKSLETFPTIANDLQVKQALVQLAGLENELAGLLEKYRDKHPLVIASRSKIANARDAVKTAAQQVADTLRSQARVALANVEAQHTAVQEWEDKQMKWNDAKMQYDVLSRHLEVAKLLWNQMLAKEKEVDLMTKEKVNNLAVVDAAYAPLKPVKPRVVVTLFLGIVGGLGIAIGLAFFVNYLDDSIKSQDDVETYLRLPFLGYVPNIKSNSVIERDLQAHLHAQSNAAEAFRTVRASMSLTHSSDKMRLITVTSTIPSEGKSLVATNVAIVLAQTGLKTLLVDADLRRPSVHKTFQLHSPIGLAAYLMETTKNMDELVHTTEVPNLDVVCCGATPQTPSELIGSKRMSLFLQEAGKRYDRVILDCPPVSAVSDPLIISAVADGVIFVTKFNKIRREHARKSIQRIQDAGIHIIGAVLNDIDLEGRDSYYYSYYYYQNRYYASHYKTAPNAEGEKPKLAETAKKG